MEVIPTGSLSLDHALGVGGLPRGRVVEVRQSRQGRQAFFRLGLVSPSILPHGSGDDSISSISVCGVMAVLTLVGRAGVL